MIPTQVGPSPVVIPVIWTLMLHTFRRDFTKSGLWPPLSTFSLLSQVSACSTLVCVEESPQRLSVAMYRCFGCGNFPVVFWGCSHAYASNVSHFIGTLKNFCLRNLVAEPLFFLYRCMFALCTEMIIIGGAFERSRMVPSMVFAFWGTIVYCPIACWTWNVNGWLYVLPALDFAGGGPVHITSGVGAFAYAFVTGKRLEHDGGKRRNHKYFPTTLRLCLLAHE